MHHASTYDLYMHFRRLKKFTTHKKRKTINYLENKYTLAKPTLRKLLVIDKSISKEKSYL